MGRHADQRADGDDTGTADAGHHDAVGVLGGRQHGRRRLIEGRLVEGGRTALAQAAALDRDEARAEAVETGIVLVTGALVDCPLAAEFGLDGHHRHAVRLGAAVAAALAYRLIDEHAAGRIGIQAALASASLLGRAGLVVDQCRYAGGLAQVALDRFQFFPVTDRYAMGQVGGAVGPLGAVGDDDDVVHAFREQLSHDHRDRQLAVHRLAAGHCDRVVIEDLVGDVHPGGHGLPDRQQSGVEIGPVAEVGKDVALAGERRLADPGHAFAAHLGEGAGAPLRHPGHHVVTADPGQRARAFRHPGRGVVRATGAEGRHPVDCEHALRQRLLLGFEKGQAGLDPVRREESGDAAGDRARDHCRRQFAGRRQQPVAMVDGAVRGRDHRPLALLVELADDPRPHVFAPVVELFLQLIFEQLALFLDHQDLVESLGEMAHPFGLERPHHADLVQPDADLGGACRVDAQVVERLAHVEIALARRDDAEPCRRRIDHHPVEAIGAAIGQCRIQLVVQQATLLHERRIGPADVQSVSWQCEVRRDPHLHPLRVDIDRGRGLDGVGERLECDPAARVARQRPTMHAIVDVFLDTARGQHRHHHRLEEVIGLVRKGRRLGGVVVAGDRQHATVLRRAGRIGVAKDVAAAIDAGAFPVPHCEHAVAAGVGRQAHLLRAPYRGCRHVLVDARLEHDVALLEVGAGLPQGLVEAAEGRAAVARNESGGVEAGTAVAFLLNHQQSHQRLIAGQIDAARRAGVLVFERSRGLRRLRVG